MASLFWDVMQIIDCTIQNCVARLRTPTLFSYFAEIFFQLCRASKVPSIWSNSACWALPIYWAKPDVLQYTCKVVGSSLKHILVSKLISRWLVAAHVAKMGHMIPQCNLDSSRLKCLDFSWLVCLREWIPIKMEQDGLRWLDICVHEIAPVVRRQNLMIKVYLEHVFISVGIHTDCWMLSPSMRKLNDAMFSEAKALQSRAHQAPFHYVGR